MTDSTEPEDLFVEAEDDTPTIRKLRDLAKDHSKELKALRKEREELAEKVQAHEKSAVFDALGIPADGTGQLFRDAYSGELDEAAVREQAEKYGLLKAPAPTATPAEQQVHEQIEQAGSAPPAAPLGLDEQIRNLDPNDPNGAAKLTELLSGVQGFSIETEISA